MVSRYSLLSLFVLAISICIGIFIYAFKRVFHYFWDDSLERWLDCWVLFWRLLSMLDHGQQCMQHLERFMFIDHSGGAFQDKENWFNVNDCTLMLRMNIIIDDFVLLWVFDVGMRIASWNSLFYYSYWLHVRYMEEESTLSIISIGNQRFQSLLSNTESFDY